VQRFAAEAQEKNRKERLRSLPENENALMECGRANAAGI
jgi:hypothetical protein